MRRHLISSSSLPRFIMPCPNCGGQMIVTSIEAKPLNSDFEDITHSCADCGCEVTRIVERRDADRAVSGPPEH
jgi:predicted RNA-binding Zn-ribbon protein involved in translation (DUF1610 family)